MSAKERPVNLESAIAVAVRAQDDDGAWDAVEALADDLEDPDAVSAAYQRVLDEDLDEERAEAIGQRAVRFREEWFGQDIAGLALVLRRVLELAPDSEWAFQRLTVAFTVAENWGDLLDLYNHALGATQDRDRQERLLEEAYQIAKDLASRPVEAMAYLRRLYALTHDAKQALALERLLEKHESWRELVQFWEQRMDHVPPAERPPLRLRIATTWFDNLQQPARSLDTLRLLLAEPGREAADQGAGDLLERLATAPQASPAVREGALDLLREHHEATGRAGDIVRVVEAALPLADVQRQIALHRDAAQRLAELGKHDAAIEHYAELLRLDPSSTTTQRALRQLAQAIDRMDRYAAAAAAAAERCPDPARKVALLTDAARVRIDLDDEVGATELLRAALSEPGIPRSDVLTVGRRLDELYARAGRSAERLPVLEKLAAAETVSSSQRALIGDIARLAEDLGQTDRALAAWRQRLARDEEDLGALSSLIDLLEKEEHWAELVDALEQRAAAGGARHGQRRADLVRVARLFERELGDESAAIGTWNRVKEVDGGLSADTVGALTNLYTSGARWRELGDLLDRATGSESLLLVDQLVRLGEAHRSHLGAPENALGYYRRAIDIDVRHERARHGLITLLDVPACRGGAADALGRAYRAVEDWPSYLTLVDARLASAADDDERLRILREAASIHERIGDPAAALSALARAFPLSPKDRALAEHVARLARHLQAYDPALEGFRRAAKALSDDPHGAAQLRAREAELLEERGDLEGAHGAYFAVLAVDPGNLAATSSVVRIGSRLARWVEVGAAIVDCIRTRGRIEETLLGEIDAAAGETHSYDEMCRVLSAAVDQGGLDPHLASEVHMRIAAWHRDRRADPTAAEASYKRAVACDATRIDALRALVALEERNPSRALYDTLERLADADPRDLDVVHRAAELAVESLGDRGLAKTSLNLLLGRASAAWRGTAPARGRLPASDYVSWAVDRLVDIHVQAQEATAALDLLVDASRLPFDAETRLALRHRAAAIAGDVLRDEAGAIEMYRGILGQKPDDLEAVVRLSDLYRKQDRAAELLALRRHELSLPLAAERRLALRLELVSLIDDIDRRGGRLELLRANMADQPGHDASVHSVTELLTAAGRLRELHDLLAEQARRLEMADQGEPSARLWSQAARLAERELRDPDRAIAAYRRVIALAPTQEALDALARLHMERSEPAEAVPWLERALAGAEPGRKAELSLRLARAHIGAERPDRATTCLERAVTEGAGNRDVRQLLADLYRQGEQWEPLAYLLTESLPMLSDEQVASAWAREAADIYHRKLLAPERALPALERALSLMPEERALRSMMAGSLRASGETQRARELLEKIIADFGRRRSKDRAQAHVELALVARAEGKIEEAVRELDQASQMDVGNPRILKLLAQIARENGQLDQAERSLRALLLVVRRQPPGDEPDAVGLAEVLFELHHISAQRGDAEKASELLESALEAARQSDAEVARLRKVLVDPRQGELLLRAIEARLAQAEDPASRAQLLLYAADAEADLLDRPGPAFERLLEAMALAPGRPDLHARARAAAIKGGSLPRYLEAATAELERMRRKQEAPRVAQLAMELGKLAEEQGGDLARARDLYRLANRVADEPTDSLFALSRVYAALGDTDGQSQVLDELAALAGDDEPTPQRADALYRLAQVQSQSPEMVARALELLERGLRIEMRHQQAAEILRAAAAGSPQNRQVLDLYERVARVSSDPAMLLDYLERRIAQGGGDDESVKEAAELAVRIGATERGDVLLRTAVEAARRGGGLASAAWAALRLAERCVERGDVAQAQTLLLEVGDAAPAAQFMELGLKLGARAAEDQPARAAEIYQLLRARDPASRTVWEPLFEIYRRMGDKAALAGLVSDTLPQLVAVDERNALRLLHARALMAESRQREAIELLRDALLDNPDDLEVSALLENALSEGGNDDVLADFLTQRFEDAKGRGNPDTLTDVALRLGALLERMEGDALSIYREALEHAPDSRALLRAVASGSGADESNHERAELLARLLAVEEEDRAPALALELAGLWEQLGETDHALEALELGHRASPGDAEIRSRLEHWYREHEQWDRLALLYIGQAERATEPEDGLARLRAAAALYREQIGDMRRAAEVLDVARSLAPDDIELVTELASCLAAGRDFDGAIRLLTQQLDDMTKSGSQRVRVDLLLLRADLEVGLGRDDDALNDLEEAHRLDPDRAGPLLRDGLERQRERAQGRGDLDHERAAAMRLAKLLLDAGQEVQARDLLVGWLERSASDREALYLVLEMDRAAERWDGVVAVCARLVSLVEGPAQVEAAVRLAEAGEKANMVQVAQQGLEYVHHVQPGSEQVRELLRRIYDQSGSHRELAALHLADAEHASDDAARYEHYRRAADILINKLGDIESAVVPAQRARELRPDDHGTVCLVADVLIGSGQIREAVELVMPAIDGHKRRSPELAALQFRMARAAAATGDRETQLAWLKRAFDVDRKDGTIAAELAQLATELGDYDLALKPLRAITLSDSPGPISRVMALLWEAKIEHARGNKAKAELWAKKALREDPSFAEAEEFLTQLSEAP